LRIHATFSYVRLVWVSLNLRGDFDEFDLMGRRAFRQVITTDSREELQGCDARSHPSLPAQHN
jgi:hypothetical protein